MGSEQSGPMYQRRPQRSTSCETHPTYKSPTTCSSPGPNSDVDVPYISYTVNRPIGDSPQLPTPRTKRRQRKKKKTQPLVVGSSSLIVVNRANVHPKEMSQTDEDLNRLQGIPVFLPIMRATLNTLNAPRDPDILERLNPTPLQTMTLLLQRHLSTNSQTVHESQTHINELIRTVDSSVNRACQMATEKQKRFAKYAEKLQQTVMIRKQLNRCCAEMQRHLEEVNSLNLLLDVDEQLQMLSI